MQTSFIRSNDNPLIVGISPVKECLNEASSVRLGSEEIFLLNSSSDVACAKKRAFQKTLIQQAEELSRCSCQDFEQNERY